MRKYWVFISMIIMAVLLGGCTKEAKFNSQNSNVGIVNLTGYPITKEKINLKMMGMHNPTMVNWDESDFFKRMESLTNIHFEFVAVSPQSYEEKKSLIFASNDLPDVFFRGALTAKDDLNYGEQNFLIPLEGLIKDYAPNLSSILEQRSDVKKAITLPSGHIISLPDIREKTSGAHLYINKKWLDKLGLSEPNNLDDFANILKAFKENDANGNGKNDEIPLSLQGIAQFKPLMSAWGLMFNEANIFVNDNNRAIFSPIQPEYKEALKYFNKLYSMKYLDNESLTQTYDQLKAKGSNGVLGAFYSAGAFTVVGQDKHFDYTTMIPLQIKGGNRVWPGDTGIKRGTFAITNKNKYPEATMRWVDYLYSEEGAKLAWAGKEGEDYKFRDDGTWDWILKDGEDQAKLRGRISVQGSTFIPEIMPYEFWSKINNKYESSLKGLRARGNLYDKVAYALVYFSIEDQKRIASISADINAYVDQMFARSVVSGESYIDNEWGNYTKILKNMGMDELVKIYQDKYDEYLKQ